MFYRHERELLRIDADFQGKLPVRHLNWFAGFGFLKINTGSVDTARLNEGQKPENKLPPVPGLYDQYKDWGVIKPEELGGINSMIKAGLVYDSRDNEVFPLRGIWSEALFSFSPSFLGDTKYTFLKLTLIHRQYFQLVKNDLVFAYRLAYQGTIAGEAPFYIQPLMLNTYSKATTIDGLGGSRTLRGILRNRVVGDGVAFANAELRWKFWRFKLFGWDFSTTASAFADAGMVVQKIKFDETGVPDSVRKEDYFSADNETPHLSYGAGFQLGVLSFVITVDYGRTTDRRDGKDGFYVGFSYLF
jgi:outer membrane protein assembly factor BamA